MLKKNCPWGADSCPQVDFGSRFCPKCGYLYPLTKGEKLANYLVLDSHKVLERFFYLVETPSGERKVIAEVLDAFQPEQRKALSEFMRVQAKRLQIPLENWFTLIEQNLPLHYSVYPEFVWQSVFQNVSQSIQELGLLDFEQMQQVYHTLYSYWQGFSTLRLCNPGINLSSLFWASNQQLLLLDWEFTVPDNNSVIYPRFYVGYHQPIFYDADRLKDYNIKIAMASIYTSIVELVTGLHPMFWSPQMPTLNEFQAMLSPQFIPKLSNYLKSLHPQELPKELPKPLRNSALGKRLQQANSYFYQGHKAYQEKQWKNAVAYFQQSNDLQGTPFSLLWLGLATAETGRIIEALSYLDKAEAQTPLARIVYEKGLLLKRLGQRQAAIEQLRKATQALPIYADAYYELGLLYQEETGTFDQAESCFKQALDIHNYPQYRYALRELYLKNDLTKEAGHLPTQLHNTIKISTSLGENTYDHKQVLCPAGHASSLGANDICPKCGLSLLPLEGDKLRDYTITEIIKLKNYEKGKKETVYKAQTPQGDWVFIKLYDLVSNQSYDAFYREKQIMESLEHPVIPPLLDSFIEQGCYGILVYPFYKGVTLQQLIEDHSCLSEVQIYQLLRALMATLVFLQSSEPTVIHGDIKPANILIGEEGKIVLLDWSSLQVIKDPAEKHTFLTTAPYATPEYALHFQLDPTFDLYALGVTLIHAATGIQPNLFVGYTEQALVDWQDYALHLSPNLRKLLTGLVAWQPQHRSHWDLKTLIEWLQQNLPTKTHTISERALHLAQAMQALSQLEDSQQCQQFIDDILVLKSNYLTFYFCAYHAQRFGLSLKAYGMLQRSLRSKPNFVQAYWLLAQFYLDKGNLEAALTTLNQSLEYCSTRPETYQLMSTVYFNQDQPTMMFAAIQKAIALAPKWSELHLEMAQYYIQIRNYQKAREIVLSIINNGPPSLIKGRAAHLLGAIEAISSHIASALEYFELALSLRPQDPLIHYDLGLLYRRTGNLEKAIRHFQQCLAFSPAHSLAQEHLQWCLSHVPQSAA